MLVVFHPTLQVLKTDMTKPNLKDYFENYANIWKQKASLTVQ